MLQIDQREKDDSFVGLVLDRCEAEGIEYEFAPLALGDYLWDETFCIERKRIDDFEKSMVSGHLDSQVVDIRNQYKHALLLVYGELYTVARRRTAMSRKQFEGKLLSIAGRVGLPYHYVKSEDRAVDAIFDVQRYIRKDAERVCNPIRNVKVGGGAPVAVELYFTLPGVGEQKAYALHEKYGSFPKFCMDYVARWRQVEAGTLTKKSFFEIYPGSLISKTTREALLHA